MQISKKASNIEPSPTLAISAKAGEMKNKGEDVVSFGAGEPDFNTPDYISKAAFEAIEKGKTNYTPTPGTTRLRRAIKNKFESDNGLNYSLEQIIVSNGAKHSLANALQATVDPGSEVIIPLPYWVSYPEMVKLADGKPVYLKADQTNNFKIKADELTDIISEDTRALILNNPGNPDGHVYNKKELEAIASVALENDLIVISDEIYEHLIYDDAEHTSFASLGEELTDATITINGMSKSFAMTGWRIGYAAGPKEIIKAMSNIQSHTTSNANSIAQYASAVGLEDKNKAQNSISKMKKAFAKRRRYILKRIGEIENISAIKPRGAFYIMMNLRNIKEKRLRDAFIFADELLEKQKVAVVPGDAFGLEGFVRLSYANSMENIKKGLDRIQEFLK